MNRENDFTLRPLTMADYEAVIELWRTAEGVGLNDADSREGLARYFARNAGLSLAAEDAAGRLVGALLAGHDGRRGYLHHLAVAAGCQGRGLGRRLVEEGLAGLAAIGITRSHVMVYPDNEAGINFWRRLGFFRRDDLCLFSRDTEHKAGGL